MQRLKLTKIFISVVVCMASVSAYAEKITDKQLLDAFRQNPYRAAAGHTPYEAPAGVIYTKAPKGYKPFYISHYGRHGSRFQGGESVFSSVCPTLDLMHSKGILTPCGDSLRMELNQMWDAHKNQMTGMLTRRGAAEHRGIAGRMCSREPEVFKQKSRGIVTCRSTAVTRCVESMGNFAMTVKGFNPSLDIQTNTDLLTGRTYSAPPSKEIKSFSGPAQNAMLKAAGSMPSLGARLFADIDEAQKCVPKEDLGKYLFEVFKAAAGAACLDINIDPLRFFTPEELLVCNSIRNIHFASSYGCFGPTRDIAVRHAYPYAQLLIEEADAAIAGNGHCADLRFAHDKQVGPLLSLLDLENYNVYTPTDQSHNCHAAWKYLSMAVNFQIIFYTNKDADVLVKFLCNERESAIPALTPVQGCYYKWEDVRSHILNRIDRGE